MKDVGIGSYRELETEESYSQLRRVIDMILELQRLTRACPRIERWPALERLAPASTAART